MSVQTTGRLHVVALNVNSIYTIQRRGTLFDFLAEHKPDLLLVSETKLRPENNLCFPGYSFVRNDRKNSGDRSAGGTGILIKSHIQFSQVLIPDILNFQHVESTIIKFSLPNNTFLFIISCYARPSDSLGFKTEFHQLFELLRLDNLQNNYLLAGDLNARHREWLNRVNNSRGTFLNTWLDEKFMRFRGKLYHTALPTFVRGDGESFIDLAIADSRITFHAHSDGSNFDVNHDRFGLLNLPYDSDHDAISMIISLENDLLLNIPTANKTGQFKFNTVNWAKFNKSLCRSYQVWPKSDGGTIVPANANLNNAEIDSGVEQLSDIITKTMDTQIKRYIWTDDASKYTNSRIKLLKRHKNECLREMFDCKLFPSQYPQGHAIYLKSIFRNLKTLLNQAFSTSQNKYWEHTFTNLSLNDPKSMFSTINRISNRANPRKQMPPLVLPMTEYANILNHPGTLSDNLSIDLANNTFSATDPHANLTLLAAMLEQVHTQNDHLGNPETNGLVRARMAEFPQADPLVNFSCIQRADAIHNDARFTNYREVRTIFKQTNTKISSGIDHIPNIVIRHLPVCMAREYCTLFNNMINNSYFPVGWKTAKVFPILKKGKDAAKPSSYRPISLLPNMSKVFEKVMQERILHFVDTNNIIPNTQFGFRRGHSTVHAISKLMSDICWHKNDMKGIGACLIDTEKAFDTVWLDGLVYKLTNLDFPSWIVSMLRQMLYGKSFLLSDFEHETQPLFSIRNGLQQGTVLAPLLFSLYTRDLLTHPVFEEAAMGIIGYADDLIVYTVSDNIDVINNQMTRIIDIVQTFFLTWKQKINTTKSESILFRRPLAKGPPNFVRNWRRFAISIDGVVLRHADTVQYLGIHLNSKCCFNEHASIQLSKARKVIHALSRIFFSRYISDKVKLICYLSLIRPIVTYGCPIWFSIDPSAMENVRRLERKCLRYCLLRCSRSAHSDYIRFESNERLYRAANIPRIDNHMIALIRNHCARSAETVENSLISHPFLSLSGEYVRKCMDSGDLPPEAFIYLDAKGYIQDRNGIPALYHIIRDYPKKRITHEPCNDCLARPSPLPIAFSTTIPLIDIRTARAAVTAYWWKRDGDGFG